jgi:hypothetical protein
MKNKKVYHLSYYLFVCLAVFLFSCQSSQIYVAKTEKNKIVTQTEEPVFSVFLIGDAGKATEDEPTLQGLSMALQQAGKNSAVVFLGDNIYPFGLPDSAANSRKESEVLLTRQLAILKNYEGQPFIIPGNHDWNMSLAGGLAAVKRQEIFVENYLKRGNTFLPDSACPDAKIVFLTSNIVLLAIDTEWWFHKHAKPIGETSYCNSKTPSEFLQNVAQTINQHKDKQIIVVGHHPIITNSKYFTWKSHIFPLTDFNKKWLVPLPILGSIYVGYRRLGLSRHDISHPNYKKLNEGLIKAFGDVALIHAAGHDHNLQLHHQNKQYYIVSGSGSKLRDAPKRHKALFVANKKGFAVIRYYANQPPIIEYYIGNETKAIFRIACEKIK